MMKRILNPDRSQWVQLVKRPESDNTALLQTVQELMNKVKYGGDQAVRELAQRFDGFELTDFLWKGASLEASGEELTPSLRKAIGQAYSNILKFHQSQVRAEEVVETMPGVRCWRRSVPIGKVGLYIPGGSAPLFSTVLMLGIPAAVAGCKDIILCTPASSDGFIHPAIRYAAHLTGISRIYMIGGVQAVAAMTYGTSSIPRVDKIFGPGNRYVTAAKQLAQQQGVAIDMPAGPSEVAVLADDTANPAYVASDLIAQAEHGPDSQVFLVSTSEELVQEVEHELERQLRNLPRADFAEISLRNSAAVTVADMDEALALVNTYAAEHLILHCEQAAELAQQVTDAGSVFIGAYSPESAGDYASGTNHTLPTNGFARAYSGVSVDSFVKKITFQELSKAGFEAIADTVIAMAEAEGLDGHANSIRVRRTNGNEHT